MNFFNKLAVFCDAPKPWGLYFQDSASPQMEALIELHDNIMFYLVIILFGVAWILVSTIKNYIYNRSPISNKYLNHGTLIELIWTITPALILILIAFPSFKLLYLMDEVTDPSLTVFVEGHQWYWSYQYPDFISDDNEELEFDSYLVPESDCITFFTNESSSSEGTSSNTPADLEDPSSSGCPHDPQNSCSSCLSLGPHREAIAQCGHNWSCFKSDKALTEALCDFGSPKETHPLAGQSGDLVYHCTQCLAVACKGCIVD